MAEKTTTKTPAAKPAAPAAGGSKSAAKPKPMSKSAVAAEMADKVGITKKQASTFFEEQAKLAYKQAKNSFTIPGIGKLVLQNRAARMGRNPATGEQIKIAAKKVVKFRVAKAAKDAILGVKK